MIEDVLKCDTWLYGYFFLVFLTTTIHCLAYHQSYRRETEVLSPFTLKVNKKDNYMNSESKLFHYLKLIFSPDYWSAYSIKLEFGDPNSIRQFITNSNHLNLMFTALIFVIYLCYDPLFKLDTFIILRAVSRAIEIMISFYDDIFQENKNSSLKMGERLKLAVYSYFEIIINFTLVYYFIQPFKNNHQLMEPDLFRCAYDSIKISTFTGVDFPGNNLQNALIALQLFSSMCLVYFALAKYIGDLASKK